MDALTERDRDWFMKHSVPRAIIAFKQGFGRLIRTTTDRGVVVVLDKRITMKTYGRLFLDSLPPVQRSNNIGDVKRFLDREALVMTPPPVQPARSWFDQ
jgi:ATP-dependent DNA helicase DinG